MKRLLLVALALIVSAQVSAEVKLPAVLGSNMVLQRNAQVNFWGEAAPRSPGAYRYLVERKQIRGPR